MKMKKVKPADPCRLCGRGLTEEYSELAYETVDEDGVTPMTVSLGKICKTCADTLDELDEKIYDEDKDM